MNDAVRAKLMTQESAHLVARDGIATVLLEGPDGGMRAVIAPAGWGKSTVLSQWIHRVAEPVAFVSFDRFDNDPVRCWVHVLAAVGEAAGVGLDPLLARLRSPGLSLVADVVDPLLNLIHDRKLLVVFDDVHSLDDAETLESLAAFIDGCPPTVSFGVASRTEPPFGLDRRRAGGALVELRIEDMAMMHAEAAEVLRQSAGRPIDSAHVDALITRTEGWPAGLHLAGLSLRGSEPDSTVVDRFAGDSRHLAAYLSSEVLAHLSDDDREFVLGVAVLNELDGGLCDAVREANDSARRLVQVARTIQFIIPTSGVIGEYRFHRAFQEWLLDEAARVDPDAINAAHRRAAQAYAERNQPMLAMDHAQRAGDWVLAHEVFTRFALQVIADGNHATVARWCRGFPGELDAELLVPVRVTEAWERLFDGDVDAAERLCHTIERLAPDAAPTDEWAGDAGQLAVIRAFCHQTRGQLVAADEEVAIARRHGVAQAIEVPLRFVAASSDYWQGRGDEGAFLEVAIRAEEQDDHYAALLAYSYIAHIHLDLPDDAKASAWVGRIFTTAVDRDMSTFWYGALAHLARARVSLASAEYGAAATDAQTAITLADRRNDTLAAFRSHLVLAEALHGAGDRPGARQHVSIAADIVQPLGEGGALVDQLRVVERQLRLPPRKAAVRSIGLPFEDLSDREMALLRLLPGDLSQRELGDALYVSFNTVKTYNRSIYRKLGVSSRDDAVQAARAAGLL